MPEPCLEPGCRHHSRTASSGTQPFFSPVASGMVQRDPAPGTSAMPRLELTAPSLGSDRPSWRDRVRLLPEQHLQLDPDLMQRLWFSFLPETFFSLYDAYPIPRRSLDLRPDMSSIPTAPNPLAPGASRTRERSTTTAGSGGSPLPGAESQTRAGTMGDVLRAVISVPEVDRLGQRVTTQLGREWNRLPGGQQVLVGITLGTIVLGGGTVMYLGGADSRRLLFQGLGSIPVPVPWVPGLNFKLLTTPDSINGIQFQFKRSF